MLQAKVGNRAVADLLSPTPVQGTRSNGHAAVAVINAIEYTHSSQHGVVQRDAAAAEAVRTKMAQPDIEQKGHGFTEAFKVLNSLPMYDMLSTLTALNRSGQFGDLFNNLRWAIGVYVDRLKVAFEAVKAKGTVTPESFIKNYANLLDPLRKNAPDQVDNIISYLDPVWLDVLKQTEDAAPVIKHIRGHKAYANLATEGRTLAEEIITEAQSRPALLVHYMTKLRQLFDTPFKDPATITSETKAATKAAATAEAKRLANPEAAKNITVEENAGNSAKRIWTPITGRFGGGVYYVDRSSPTSIVVRARVFLRAAGTGTKTDVAKIRAMEDAIEKAASTKGYLVDIIFVDAATVDKKGNAPFTVDVDPGRWQVATNWAGGSPKGLAHELHHLCAFELDRYDYIQAHSTNTSMAVDQRLIWFRKEMTKPDGFNDDTSIMNNAEHPNDDDVCRVAGLDITSCVNLRKKAHVP